MPFTFYKQLNAMDCGPTCLRMIARYYGRHYNADSLRQSTGFSKRGVSLLGVCDTAEKLGFATRGIKISYQQLREVLLPCIVHWDQKHFVVVTKLGRSMAKVADPGKGILKYSKQEFLSHWLAGSGQIGDNSNGIVLLMEPTPQFYKNSGEKENKLSWKQVTKYLRQSRVQLFQVFVALMISTLLQFTFPFLTQGIVDKGINTNDLQFVGIILIAQTTLTFSQTIVNFIRGRLIQRISNLLNLQILSDFWMKLTRLPVSYFDVRHTGDTLQRIGDHSKIQNFLTGPALNILFSVFNFAVYAAILIVYSTRLFIVFLIGSTIYFIWVQFFLRIRRKINYETFHLSSKENNATLQLIQGMQEIRLNNAEKQKRWEWENIQASLFTLNFRSLNYSQWQAAGSTLINQLQNIVISYIAAKLVIEGQLTLGSMLAVQYIIGQLSGPIGQWVGFIQSAQDAKISMERLNEIHQLPDEEIVGKVYEATLPVNRRISLHDFSFTYPGAGNTPVLDRINLDIPEGKVTAIVGSSGSGKTTLLKILLKVYEQYEGEIRLGMHTETSPENMEKQNTGINFNSVRPSYWRHLCGAVLQDGYVFNDTIEKNIAVGCEQIDNERLIQSCKVANIFSYIESLPNGFNTLMGAEGAGLSQGQRQRLLIARAVYKDPDYLFFDEATNALDANNEREIVENLNRIFNGKTVVVVAHRLSTVRHADKIVVLHQGQIVEEGTHDQLTAQRGRYYSLVKNQLEMAS